jgi:putative salt-induced outer membrane protein YdiY
MRNGFSPLMVLGAVLLISVSALGGQVYLENGDRLSGTITTMANGMITIQTALAGTVQIPMANVQTISSDEPLELHLNDGTIVKQPVEKDSEGTIKIAGSDVIDSQTLGLTQVMAINPPKPEVPKWKADVSAALSYASGNTNNESYAISGNLAKQTEKDRFTFNCNAANKKEKSGGKEFTTENWWRSGGKYDYFLGENKYLFGEGRYQTDEVADLDRRIIVGTGAGYQWIKKEIQNFSTELGFANVYEKYETSSNGDSKLSLRMGYQYDQQFNKVFSFVHGLTYYPDVDNFSDYFLTSTSTELRAKINSHLFANFKVLFDYDATPATDKGNTDVKYLFGIGMNI